MRAALREAGAAGRGMDARDEKIGYRIREAEVQKVPYMLVVGMREAEAGVVAVRAHGRGDQGQKALAAFAEEIVDEESGPVVFVST